MAMDGQKYILHQDDEGHLSHLFSSSSTAGTIGSGLFPPAVRVVRENVIAVERPPSRVMVSYYNGNKYIALEAKEERRELYEIQLPWMMYIIPLSRGTVTTNISIFARTEPYTGDDEGFYYFPLPNVQGGQVCTSTSLPETKGKPLSHAVLGNITSFYNSGFNNNAHYTPSIGKEAADILNIRRPISWSSYFQALEIATPQTVLEATAHMPRTLIRVLTYPHTTGLKSAVIETINRARMAKTS